MAEQFWPGVTPEQALSTFDALRTSCRRLADEAVIRFAGATFFPDDETLAARFEGSGAAVVAAYELANCRFDRLSRAVEVDG